MEAAAQQCVPDKAASVGSRPAGRSYRASASSQRQVIDHPQTPAEGLLVEDRVGTVHGDRLRQDSSKADRSSNPLHAKGRDGAESRIATCQVHEN